MLNYSIQQNGDFYEIIDNNIKTVIAGFSIESDAIDYFQQLLHAENNYVPPTYEELQSLLYSMGHEENRNYNQPIYQPQPVQMQQASQPQLIPYPQFVPVNFGGNNSNGEPTVSLREVQEIMNGRINNNLGTSNNSFLGNVPSFDDNSLALSKANFENGAAVVNGFSKKVNNMFDVTMDLTNSPTMQLPGLNNPYWTPQKPNFNDKSLIYNDIDVEEERPKKLEVISDRFVKEDPIIHNFNDKKLFADEKEGEPKKTENIKKAVKKIADS